MSPKVTAVLLASALTAGAANAHGSGSFGAMPGISYTDMPAYAPKPIKPVKRAWRHTQKHCGASAAR
jgi:hypothetical protein